MVGRSLEDYKGTTLPLVREKHEVHERQTYNPKRDDKITKQSVESMRDVMGFVNTKCWREKSVGVR